MYPDSVDISWSSSGVIHAIQDFSDFDMDIWLATRKSGIQCPNLINGITKYVDLVFKKSTKVN